MSIGMSLPSRLLWNFVSTRSLFPEGIALLVGVERGSGVSVLVADAATVVARETVPSATRVGVDELVGLGLGVAVFVAVGVGVGAGRKAEQPISSDAREGTQTIEMERAKNDGDIALVVQFLAQFFVTQKL